jgi:ABC transport system ATP-binding/permease protein
MNQHWGSGESGSAQAEGTGFLIRWRGKTSGPYSLAQLERKLARREIGMLHEVLWEGRWIPLRTLEARIRGGGSDLPLDLPGEGSTATLPSLEGDPGIAAGESFYLRWRGGTVGPLSLAEIERKLDRREIGMLHEVSCEGRWVKLNDFFVQRNLAVAQERATVIDKPKIRPPSGKMGARMVLQRVAQRIKSGNKILDDINLVVEPNEFIALLGPSGSGKSTLMNAMTGRRRASDGTITLNGEDFYANSAKFRHKIGHVPQKDIVHLTLTVSQTLSFAAQLRLPATTTASSIAQRVSEVVQQTQLQERTGTRNSDLSGGQLKRVSLGVELLSDPELLFLDEATSGLDAGTEARMMTLFRRLADDGRTVVCITHNLENVALCDLVVVLVAGRLAYYGPTAELAPYFGVEKVSQIYDALETKKPDEWAQQYASSPFYEKFVAARLKMGSTVGGLALPPAGRPNAATVPECAGGWRQFLILTRRYLAVTLQDRRNVMLLLAQAPIIALLLGLVFRTRKFDVLPNGPFDERTLAFLLVISSIWFGCINAAREIVKELPIYLRERAVNLNLGSYLSSKIAILSLLCAIQCGLLFGITRAMVTGFQPDIGSMAVSLLLTSAAGMLMGLVVSALVQSEDKAMAIVPILLIPQVIFSGAIMKLTGLALDIGKWAIVGFWSFNATVNLLPHKDKLDHQPHGTFAEDIVTICLFLIALTFMAGFALKRKDPLK